MSKTPDEPTDFASLFAAYEKEQAAAAKGAKEKTAGRGPQPGDRVSGRIVGFGEESAFVDLGGKSEGVIPLHELTDADGERTVSVGDSIEAFVAGTGDEGVVLRVRGAVGRGQSAPAELAQAHVHGLPVEGTVTGVVKGGVEVTVAGVRGFCPISQLEDRYVADAAEFVGRHLSFRITRLEEGRGRPNLVLSRRSLLEEEKAARAAEVRATLAPGKIVRGTVTSLASYGAFVDLGGIEGLLHVSQLGHARVDHPQDVLAVGQEVEVQVLDIKPDAKGQERISLSRRALLRDPWMDEVAKLTPGAKRSGRVARLETFGAFVELAPGVDGLLHVSEMGGGKPVRHPREAVKVGQTLEVTIKSVDPERRRIALALGQAEEAGTLADLPTEAPGFGAMAEFFARAKKS